MDEKIKEMLKEDGWNDYVYRGKIGNKEIYSPYVKNEIGYVRSVKVGRPKYIICENGNYSWLLDKDFKIMNSLPEVEWNLLYEAKNYIYKKLHSKVKEEEEIFREHDKLFEKYLKSDELIFNSEEEKEEYYDVLVKVWDIIEKYKVKK